MFIYEHLNELDVADDELAVKPLSYVALGCAR